MSSIEGAAGGAHIVRTMSMEKICSALAAFVDVHAQEGGGSPRGGVFSPPPMGRLVEHAWGSFPQGTFVSLNREAGGGRVRGFLRSEIEDAVEGDVAFSFAFLAEVFPRGCSGASPPPPPPTPPPPPPSLAFPLVHVQAHAGEIPMQDL